MEKPNNFDNTKAYGDYEPLKPGGHLCVIKKVEETTSKNGNPMIMVYLDTDKRDTQPGFYSGQWNNDSRPVDERRWGCIVYQVTTDKSGDCSRGFKGFITAVQESNPGFVLQWGARFCDSFKGLKIGGVFRREEYRNFSGEYRWSVKCYQFRSTQAIEKGVPVPEDKPLDMNKQENRPFVATAAFSELDNDDDLPF